MQVLIPFVVLLTAVFLAGIGAVLLLDEGRNTGARRLESAGELLILLALVAAGSALLFVLLANLAEDPALKADAQWCWRRVGWCLLPVAVGELLRRYPGAARSEQVEPVAPAAGAPAAAAAAAPAAPAPAEVETLSRAGGFWFGLFMVVLGSAFLVGFALREELLPIVAKLFDGMRRSRAGAVATHEWQYWTLGAGLVVMGLWLSRLSRRRR